MVRGSNPTRTEDVGPTAGKPREVAAYVFYPAQPPSGSQVENYPGLTGLANAAETSFLRQQFGRVFARNQIERIAKQPGSILQNRLDLSRIGVFGHSEERLPYEPVSLMPGCEHDTAPGYVHASFMDIRLLAPNPARQAVINHRTGTKITRAFFDARLRTGDQKDWAAFEASPGEGIRVERPSGKR